MNALDRPQDFELARLLTGMVEKRFQGGFWITELPSRATTWSDGMYALLDYDRGSFLPTFASINDATHPDDRRSAAELETAITSGIGYDREQRLITARGRLRWISARIEFVLDETGAPQRLVGIIHDVSPLHQQRQVAAALKERFGVLISAAALLVWSARPDGFVDSINGLERLGYQQSPPIQGWSWLDTLIHPEHRSGVADAWRTAIESGHAYERELRLRRKDGSYIWALAKALPVRSAAGEIVEWIGSAIDIQAQKEWQVDPTDSALVSGAQLRAARGLLNWSVNRLATDAEVSCSLIRRLEEFDGVNRNELPTLVRLKATLRQAGAEFMFPPNGKGGVRPV